MGQQPLSALSFEELLQRARAREEGALQELFLQCETELERWAEQQAAKEKSGSPSPSDISQEAWERVFKHFSTFRGQTKGEWFAWIKSVVFSQAHQLRRAERRQAVKTSGALPLDADEVQEVPALQPSPSQLTSHKEQWRQLLKSLSEMLDDQREALRLYYMKELRVAEVAERMNKTQTSVSSLLQRGLAALRNRMNGETHEETEPAPPVTAAFLVYLKRREAGEPVNPEAFAAEHPDCAAELRSLLAWVEPLRELGRSSSSS
jgi:RNA polymerase sigma-70 factor (ECF subfamily)